MCVRNRIIAVFYRVCALILGLLAIICDFGIFNGEFKVINFFYFTIISNLFCLGLFSALSILTVRDILKKGVYGTTSISPHIKGEILISILLTMSVYHFILIPYALRMNPYQTLKISDIVLHYFIPVLTLFDWLLFDEKKSFKWYDPIVWTIGPYLYIVFVFIQAGFNIVDRVNAHINNYIYAFLDVRLLGEANVIFNIVSLTIVFILVGYLIYGIDRIRIADD